MHVCFRFTRRNLHYLDAFDVGGDHGRDVGRRLAHGHAAVGERREVVASGAGDEQGLGEQVIEPVAVYLAGADHSRLGVREQLDLLSQGDRPVSLHCAAPHM